MNYRITNWGPGYRQHLDHHEVGELAVEVEDVSRVLFPDGFQRMVIKKIPGDVFILTTPDGLPAAGDARRDDRLCKFLLEAQREEILEHLRALPERGDCRPSLKKIRRWVNNGRTEAYHSREKGQSEMEGRLHFKRKPFELPDLEFYRFVGWCSVCNEKAYKTPSGSTCRNGHGGAPLLPSGPE